MDKDDKNKKQSRQKTAKEDNKQPYSVSGYPDNFNPSEKTETLSSEEGSDSSKSDKKNKSSLLLNEILKLRSSLDLVWKLAEERRLTIEQNNEEIYRQNILIKDQINNIERLKELEILESKFFSKEIGLCEDFCPGDEIDFEYFDVIIPLNINNKNSKFCLAAITQGLYDLVTFGKCNKFFATIENSRCFVLVKKLGEKKYCLLNINEKQEIKKILEDSNNYIQSQIQITSLTKNSSSENSQIIKPIISGFIGILIGSLIMVLLVKFTKLFSGFNNKN